MQRTPSKMWTGLVIVAVAVAAGLYLWPPWPQTQQHLFVVELDPRTVRMLPALTRGKVCRTESFSEAVHRLKPYAATSGTFYDNQLNPLGDILIDGKLVNQGRYLCAIAVSNDGEISFVRRKGDRFDWSGYRCALAAGPRLISHGQIEIDAAADGFTERGLPAKAPRSGIALTRQGNLLLIVERDFVTLDRFAATMRDKGAVDAMNLDGGPAAGLYHDGKMLVSAPLRMTNLLLFYRKQ